MLHTCISISQQTDNIDGSVNINTLVSVAAGTNVDVPFARNFLTNIYRMKRKCHEKHYFWLVKSATSLKITEQEVFSSIMTSFRDIGIHSRPTKFFR